MAVFKFETNELFHYILAPRFIEAEKYFNENRIKDVFDFNFYQLVDIDKFEWFDKAFFIGEAGTEFDENAWCSLTDLIHHTPDKIGYLFYKDKCLLNYKDYVKTYSKHFILTQKESDYLHTFIEEKELLEICNETITLFSFVKTYGVNTFFQCDFLIETAKVEISIRRTVDDFRILAVINGHLTEQSPLHSILYLLKRNLFRLTINHIAYKDMLRDIEDIKVFIHTHDFSTEGD